MKTFEPVQIQKMKIDNRVGVAPMCTFLCDTKDGVANEFHMVHYCNLALGQPGMIIQEATSINDQGYISDHCLGIYKPRQKEALTKLVELVHRYPSKIGIQLNHAGKKSKHSNITKIGPMDEEGVVGASQDEIKKIVDDFAAAAKSARNIGYDFVEIHAAHGYLINQFLSPVTNQRHDEYGQDRFLLLKEVIMVVKHEFDGPISVRISADEYEEGGNTIEDSIEIAKKCEQLGISMMNISSGAFAGVPFDPYPLYQVKLAQAIKQHVSIPVATAGLISTIEEIEGIVSKDEADIVLLGRKLLVDPYFVLKEKYKQGLILEGDVSNYLYRGLTTLDK
jgi:NADPH2 dehydrogenase